MAESGNTVATIDMALLRRQKRSLVEVQQIPEATAQAKTEIEGLLNLLDFVQDQIVDQGLASDAEVFGFSSRSKVPSRTRCGSSATRRG